MQSYEKLFLTAAALLVSVGLWAQDVYRFRDPDLLARLSYDASPVVQREGVRHICVAVSRDEELSDRAITPEQFQQLEKLLGSAAFRVL